MTRFHSTRMVFAAALVLMLIVSLQLGCQDQDPVGADGLVGSGSDPAENTPPETYISLGVEEGKQPDTTTSSTTINWWGEDPDGRVESYEFRWGLIEMDDSGAEPVPVDTQWYDEQWQFTTGSGWVQTQAEGGSFILPIRTADATFLLEVRARDNSGALDPDPAKMSFPIVNSPPSVEFRVQSNPTSFANATFATFDVRSFVWDATDPDGNESVYQAMYALDPTPTDTNWVPVTPGENTVTLRNIPPGEHVFWLKVVDVAGFESSPIHFPDTTVTSDPRRWQVKEPAGRYLIVDDYWFETSNTQLNWYRQVFNDAYPGGEGVDYSVYEIGKELPYVNSDLVETLMKFDRILWFTYYRQPLLFEAFNAMYTFINSPGKRMILTTMSVDTGLVLDLADSLERVTIPDIYGLESVFHRNGDPVILETDSLATGLPAIQLQTQIPREVYGIVPSEGADVLYNLDPSTNSPAQYEGEPIVAVSRPDRSYTLITVPLYPFGNVEKVSQMIQELFDE